MCCIVMKYTPHKTINVNKVHVWKPGIYCNITSVNVVTVCVVSFHFVFYFMTVFMIWLGLGKETLWLG